jgi:hypothetical protein
MQDTLLPEPDIVTFVLSTGVHHLVNHNGAPFQSNVCVECVWHKAYDPLLAGV